MPLVVADAGPLNYLVRIGAVDVLSDLFGEVVIPASVRNELLHPKAPEVVRQWAAELPSWATLMHKEGVLIGKLGRGESEALALAESLGAFGIIVDDADARAVAREKQMRIYGTIGVLEQAAKEGLIDLPEIFSKLRATNFRGSDELFDAALARDRARKQP